MKESYENAMSLIDEIRQLAEEVPVEGEDFAKSVLGKAASMEDNIESYESATSNQLRALENMANGLEKWVRR